MQNIDSSSPRLASLLTETESISNEESFRSAGIRPSIEHLTSQSCDPSLLQFEEPRFLSRLVGFFRNLFSCKKTSKEKTISKKAHKKRKVKLEKQLRNRETKRDKLQKKNNQF